MGRASLAVELVLRFADNGLALKYTQQKGSQAMLLESLFLVIEPFVPVGPLANHGLTVLELALAAVPVRVST
jgi:hypothetical protein